MKRTIPFILILCLLLCGCASMSERLKNPVTFYYLRSDYQYFDPNGVIASEEREGAGHIDDLSYLLALYLMGPAQDELRSPLPANTKIYMANQEEASIHLMLSSLDGTLSDIEFSAAGACLALTCFDLTDAQTVTVESGERSLLLTRDNILYYMGGEPAPEETQ